MTTSSKIIQLLKGVPLVLWGVIVWAFQTGPEEITSKTAAWAKWFGYPDLPTYVLAKSTDAYVLTGAVIIAVLYVTGVWIWPWFHNKYPRLIPIQEAARIGFEEAERLEIEDAISSIHQPLGDKLSWFQYAFLCDENIELFGRKVPSRRLRFIPVDDRRRLKPHSNRNELVSEFASETLVYTDVAVTRSGLRRYLRMLRRLSEQAL